MPELKTKGDNNSKKICEKSATKKLEPSISTISNNSSNRNQNYNNSIKTNKNKQVKENIEKK